MNNWIIRSNRPYHLLIGFLSAIVGTIIGAIEVACALEGKDCQHAPINNGKKPWQWNFQSWDWLDFLATVLGGIVGQAMQVLIIYLIIK